MAGRTLQSRLPPAPGVPDSGADGEDNAPTATSWVRTLARLLGQLCWIVVFSLFPQPECEGREFTGQRDPSEFLRIPPAILSS